MGSIRQSGVSTGINLNEECIDALKQMKNNMAFRYILLKLNDISSEVIVSSVAPPGPDRTLDLFPIDYNDNVHLQELNSLVGNEPFLVIFGMLNLFHLQKVGTICKQWRSIIRFVCLLKGISL